MAAHTPAPWKVVEEPYKISVECNDSILSEVYLTDETRSPEDEREAADERQSALANARLIAAAPDLLEALQRVADCLSKCLTGGEVSAKLAGNGLVQAAEAIAKATGGTD